MRVAILGYGIEGQSAYNFYAKKHADITIFDQAQQPKSAPPQGAHFVGGQASFTGLEGYDVIVRTPAVNPDQLKALGAKVTSATKLFFEHCPQPIIGITGTKGKGTTASLIHALLHEAHIKSWLVGNIGVAALDALEEIQTAGEGIVVYELSSFQLWDMTISPHTAVVLMIDQDHLDVHGSIDNYIQAKANIARWQMADDTVIHHPRNEQAITIAKLSKGHHISFGVAPAARVRDDNIFIEEQKICSVSSLQLPGEHNLENICAAVTACWQYTQDSTAISKALADFKGLEHRLETVKTVDKITYINDSFSSAPAATQVALAAFTQPKILIAGGYDRGGDFADMAKTIAAAHTLRQVLLIGQTRHKLAEQLKSLGFADFTVCDAAKLDDIVLQARSLAHPGDIILLSPGCPSFDMFDNFYERGNQFKSIVGGLQSREEQ